VKSSKHDPAKQPEQALTDDLACEGHTSIK